MFSGKGEEHNVSGTSSTNIGDESDKGDSKNDRSTAKSKNLPTLLTGKLELLAYHLDQSKFSLFTLLAVSVPIRS